MAREVSLSVNNIDIKLDNFVEGYFYHVVVGILNSLKDTDDIRDLKLEVDNDGQVEINLNGAEVPLSYFPVQIIRSTLAGMVANLKGVDGEMSTMELRITR